MPGFLALSFDDTLGAAFIGFSFALLLYGVTCLQTIIYFHKCRNDSTLLKLLVAILWLMDCLHIILISHGTYVLLVTFHSAPFSALARPPWSYSSQVYVTVISNLLVRTVFANRIYRLSHGNVIIPVIVIALSFYVLASGIVFGTEALRATSWAQLKNFSWSMYSGYGAEMTADSIIAVSMSVLLVKMRTGLRSSDSLVQTFVMYSINTGLLTTVCVFLSLITFITMPNSLAFLACYFVLSRLYVNSLLGTLNARSKMQSTTDAVVAAGANKLNLSGNTNSNTDSSAYTSSSSGPGAGALLTSAIMLGTTELGTDTMAGEDSIRQFEEEREKSRHTTPRSGYSKLEDV